MENIEQHAGVHDWATMKFVHINYLLNQPVEVDNDITLQWLAPQPELDKTSVSSIQNSTATYFTYGPLLQTTWRQSIPSNYIGYNNFVRYNNCNQGTAPVGCVATAMGQILKYHNRPDYTSSMPNLIDINNYTTQGAHYIASLLQYIGSSVNMQYTCSSSSAYSKDARKAFDHTFNYTVSGLDDLDNNRIKNDIYNYRPVYLEGCADRQIKSNPKKLGIFKWTIGNTSYKHNDCHAWITDGVEGVHLRVKHFFFWIDLNPLQYIHMNWGWRGRYNGWYDYQIWNNTKYIGDGPADNYQYKQRMLTDIKPRYQ